MLRMRIQCILLDFDLVEIILVDFHEEIHVDREEFLTTVIHEKKLFQNLQCGLQ